MTHDLDGERKAPLGEDDVGHGKAGHQPAQPGSFVGALAAARGMSPALLQRKIQRRASERRDAADSGAATEVAEAHGGPGDSPHGGQTEDPNVVELKTKVGALVKERFGGDFKKAFDHYDASHDGGVDKSELVGMLKDADVGSGLTRGIWAKKIIEKMDANHDGRIQWSEFEAGIKG